MKISVVIPAYNLSNYIEKTLQSIVASDYSDMEIIVVDDGSTDDTAAVVEEYISEHAQIKLIRQTNQGVSAARNTGIREASGEYIIFVDGDDICAENMLSKVVNVLNNSQLTDQNRECSKPDEGEAEGIQSDDSQSCLAYADMLVWRFVTRDKFDEKLSQKEFAHYYYSSKEFLRSLVLNENRIRIGSFAIRRDLIINNRIEFTKGCAVGEDVEFMLKAIISASSVLALNDCLYTYVKREGSAANTFDMRRFQAPFAMERVYEFAKDKLDNEQLLTSIRDGLYLTHCMFAFDSCCRYIDNTNKRKEFLKAYFTEYSGIEEKLCEIKRRIVEYPRVFSKKRVLLFLMSRSIYTWKMQQSFGVHNK